MSERRLAGVLLGIALFAALVAWGPMAAKEPTAARSPATPTRGTLEPRLRPAPPQRLAIPRLGVRARVVAVTVGPDRTMRPPRRPDVVGWWSGSVAPGAARGRTVVAGHAVHTGGGAFDQVSRLRKGDRIDVRTASGVMRYAVERVRTYHKDALADAAEAIFAQHGPPRLVLISCDDWDGRRYLSNVVVVAAPVRAVPTRERRDR